MSEAVPKPPREITPGMVVRIETLNPDFTVTESDHKIATIGTVSPGRYGYTIEGETKPRYVGARETLNVVA